MTDREKVINALARCESYGYCKDMDCPYYKNTHCLELLRKDALTLLKEQDNCENCAIAIEDRQPVVRCKECKYWRQLYGDRPFYSHIGCCDCNDMWRSLDGETTEVNDINTDSDFYCGHAERR